MIISLHHDEPLFIFRNTPLRQGHFISVDTLSPPQHGDLVVVKVEDQHSVRRYEVIHAICGLWPSFGNEELVGIIHSVS